jgi:hypothetical protein
MSDHEWNQFLAESEAKAEASFKGRSPKYAEASRRAWETRRKMGTAGPSKGTTVLHDPKFKIGPRALPRWRPRNKKLRCQKKKW